MHDRKNICDMPEALIMNNCKFTFITSTNVRVIMQQVISVKEIIIK
jgi:hypothetical protein